MPQKYETFTLRYHPKTQTCRSFILRGPPATFQQLSPTSPFAPFLRVQVARACSSWTFRRLGQRRNGKPFSRCFARVATSRRPRFHLRYPSFRRDPEGRGKKCSVRFGMKASRKSRLGEVSHCVQK